MIGRQARPELYNLDAVKPAPLVPDNLRCGVGGRVTASGEIIEELDETALSALPGRLRKAKVESVAICLLFSFVDPKFEERIAEALSVLAIPLSVSHQILPEYREFERTSTVTINAYLQPLMGTYLQRLATNTRSLRVMQSSGGSISALSPHANRYALFFRGRRVAWSVLYVQRGRPASKKLLLSIWAALPPTWRSAAATACV